MSAGMRGRIGKAALAEVLAASGVKVTLRRCRSCGSFALAHRSRGDESSAIAAVRRDRRAFLSAARNRRRGGARHVNDPDRADAARRGCRDCARPLALRGAGRSVPRSHRATAADAQLLHPRDCGSRARARPARPIRAVKDGRAIGPLHGVPLAHKDMFYRAGEVCTCGSKIRADFVPDHTATVLTRLDAAGGIELGRLNMAEFAMGPTGHNEHFGRCRNPWNPDYITGGSSSGSGAAVAAGLAFGALGSDTGGSVRLPAAACGVVGIKPTLGRVSRYGTMPLSHSLDCIGVLARTVGDCARLLSVIAGADEQATACRAGIPFRTTSEVSTTATPPRSLAGVTVGVPNHYYYDGVDQETAEALAASRAVLEARGAKIADVPIGDHGAINDLAAAILSPEAAALHLPWLRERPQDYAEQTRARLLVGLGHTRHPLPCRRCRRARACSRNSCAKHSRNATCCTSRCLSARCRRPPKPTSAAPRRWRRCSPRSSPTPGR